MPRPSADKHVCARRTPRNGQNEGSLIREKRTLDTQRGTAPDQGKTICRHFNYRTRTWITHAKTYRCCTAVSRKPCVTVIDKRHARRYMIPIQRTVKAQSLHPALARTSLSVCMMRYQLKAAWDACHDASVRSTCATPIITLNYSSVPCCFSW